ncbi:MAG: radical SAM protein [Syntrophobacteraceae bacterium]|nr:radical SAM protein [Syntrophobacteraceae bacterium]
METFEINGLQLTLQKQGETRYSKVSYPLRYGRYAELRTPAHLFQFNLNGELKFITGRGRDWPNPSEWLKRTVTGDWVYYSAGGYDGPFDCFGEYYIPCFSYPTNNINSCDPFEEKAVVSAIEAAGLLHEELARLDLAFLSAEGRKFLELVKANPPAELLRKAATISEILGDSVSVLPPDTRHVDYEVIPLIVADGCLYKCGFCRVKSRLKFKERSKENIERQIKRLRDFFGNDLANYNSVFFGQHDALHSDPELIEFAARRAFEAFDLKNSNIADPRLFLFGSVDSLLKSNGATFDRIDRLPFTTYINVGLESADRETLGRLKKSITAEGVEAAFAKIADINKRYERIEITSNFVFGPGLPVGHMESVLRLIQKHFDRPSPKGAVYFSPFFDAGDSLWKKNIKREFYKLKIKIPVPSFLYLIQRL